MNIREKINKFLNEETYAQGDSVITTDGLGKIVADSGTMVDCSVSIDGNITTKQYKKEDIMPAKSRPTT